MRFKDMLRYRQTWLGVAMLWIILFHLPFSIGKLDFFKSIGYGGVDICIFASGIGCFCSLSYDSDIFTFTKKRLKRLVPTYLIFIIVWLMYQYICGNFGFQMAIGNIFAVQNFTGHPQAFNWYISAIFLFYILAPYFKVIVDRLNFKHRCMFLFFLILFSIPFWNADTYIITVTRLPIFYLGMIFADICQKNNKIIKKDICSMFVSFIIGVFLLFIFYRYASQNLWSCGLHWYPFIFLTPPLCFMISYVSIFLKKTKITKWLVDFLSLCGDYSFELYMVHILLVDVTSRVISYFNLSGWFWLSNIILIPIGCFALRRFTLLCRKFSIKQTKKRLHQSK